MSVREAARPRGYAGYPLRSTPGEDPALTRTDADAHLTEVMLEGDAYRGMERREFVARRFKDAEADLAG